MSNWDDKDDGDDDDLEACLNENSVGFRVGFPCINKDGVPGFLKISRDPDICAGHPTIAGTRMPIHDIIAYVRLYGGDDVLAHREEMPHLPFAMVRAAVQWYDNYGADEINAILAQREVDYQEGLEK